MKRLHLTSRDDSGEKSSHTYSPSIKIVYTKEDIRCYRSIHEHDIHPEYHDIEGILLEWEKKKYLRECSSDPCKAVFRARIVPDFFQCWSQYEEIYTYHRDDRLCEWEVESDIDDSDTEGETYIVKNIDFYLLYEVPSYTASDTQT